jgi:hypothetical protein
MQTRNPSGQQIGTKAGCGLSQCLDAIPILKGSHVRRNQGGRNIYQSSDKRDHNAHLLRVMWRVPGALYVAPQA